MSSKLRDGILEQLAAGPASLTAIRERQQVDRRAAIEAVGILISRGAVREVGEGRHKRIELVAGSGAAQPRPRPTPMLDQLRALSPADRAVVLEGTAAVAQSVVDDLEAARAGATGPFNLHACDVLGIATALLYTIEHLAARDRALAAWEEAAHATAPEPPTARGGPR